MQSSSFDRARAPSHPPASEGAGRGAVLAQRGGTARRSGRVAALAAPGAAKLRTGSPTCFKGTHKYIVSFAELLPPRSRGRGAARIAAQRTAAQQATHSESCTTG